MDTASRSISIIEAPVAVGIGLAGSETLSRALLSAGLENAVSGKVAASLAPLRLDHKIDELNADVAYTKVHDFSLNLADSVESVIRRNGFPVVVGGDCTILLGCATAASRQGIAGLLFVDGHTDFSEPGKPDYETASMDLAIVTGRGPKTLTELHGTKPLFLDRNVVTFGYRDETSIVDRQSADPTSTDITCISLDAIRAEGFGNMCHKALDVFQSTNNRFWIHLDLDVIDDAVISAVDYRMPDGLSVGEVVAVLRRALSTRQVAGLDISILNPTLDWDGSQTKLMVEMLEAAFRQN